MRRSIVRNFQSLIVSAVKICKHCLKTAQLLVDETLYWDFALDPQDLLGYCPWSENSWRRHWADSVVFSWHGSKCTQMRWLKVPDYQWTWVHYEILGLCVLCRSADLRAFTVYSLVSILTRDDRVSDGARFLRRVTDTYIRWQWRNLLLLCMVSVADSKL